ncbi:hypothetical protein K523DRAFT_255547, partial [Schizophyllum commune Tattone D]
MEVDLPSTSAGAARDEPEANPDHSARGRGPARVAPIAVETSPREVLDKVLSQGMTVTLKDLLGVSKELRTEIQEAIRPKGAPRPAPNVPTAIVHTVTRGKAIPSPAAVYATRLEEDNLIRLELMCEGTPIKAIIDTGSQINVM